MHLAAPLIVIAAGTIHTPALLARSGLGGNSGQLGRNLSLHPATASAARIGQLVDIARACRRVSTSTDSPPWASSWMGPRTARVRRDVVAGDRPPARRGDAGLPATGAIRADGLRQLPRVRCASSAGRPVIRYDLNGEDLERFRIGLRGLEQLFVAAGAREMLLPLLPGVRAGERPSA